MNLKEKTNNENKKLSRQVEKEQNQRNGHHMEGLQWVERGGIGGKVQGRRSIISRHKIDGER